MPIYAALFWMTDARNAIGYLKIPGVGAITMCLVSGLICDDHLLRDLMTEDQEFNWLTVY
ncbi:uncharacterized protein FIBRA_06920 [Fibroporia radiculosa]|uniref:Uncharacterized protein n=1 Tax=Fibroporia radiculosa TaxID=599839 RepID=J4HZV2_9APHY|nr:uncharacterized protein FIBRA_06920 [Fibroporia radiculosa]CCM04732.1 predicted protein [Fibroporia radiculosa]